MVIFTPLEINEIPLYVGSNGSFIPQRKEVRRLADKILSDHPLLGIIATTANSDGNSVKSNSSEEELREYQYRHQYEFQIKYIGMVLSILFQKIIEKELLNSENIYTHLSKNELFTPDDFKAVSDSSTLESSLSPRSLSRPALCLLSTSSSLFRIGMSISSFSFA